MRSIITGVLELEGPLPHILISDVQYISKEIVLTQGYNHDEQIPRRNSHAKGSRQKEAARVMATRKPREKGSGVTPFQVTPSETPLQPGPSSQQQGPHGSQLPFAAHSFEYLRVWGHIPDPNPNR